MSETPIVKLPRWVAVVWPWLSVFSTIVILGLPVLTYMNYAETRDLNRFFVRLEHEQRARQQQRQDSVRIILQKRVDSLQNLVRERQ